MKQPAAYQPMPWQAPLNSHPAGIVHAAPGALEKWIRWAYNDAVDRASFSGHVFLYNISLQTFSRDTFITLWSELYGYPAPKGLLDVVEDIHIIVPYHKGVTKPFRKSRPVRVANWLNWSYITELLEELVKNEELRNLAMSTFRRTWVSFVPVIDQTLGGTSGQLRQMEPDTPFEGEYSFGIYAKVERSQSGEKSFYDNLAGAHSKGPNVEYDNMMAQHYVADRVRLVLAAGIDEPFTSRPDGLYQYDLILSCAPREYISEQQKQTCALRAHVKVLSKLWAERRSPLTLWDSDFFSYCPGVIREKELRFDAFMAWSEIAIQRDDSKAWWSIGKSRLQMQKGAFTQKLKNYTEWEPTFDRDRNIEVLLDRTEIHLPSYAPFENQDYYRSNGARTIIERDFKQLLVDGIGLIAKKERPAKPIILVLGPSGTGKTKLVNAAGQFFMGCKPPLGAEYKYKKIAGMSADDVIAFANEVNTQAAASNSAAILALDEVHKVANLGELTGQYSWFEDASQVLFILITSFADGSFESFQKALHEIDPDSDFPNRVHAIELPPFSAEDEMLVLASSFLEGSQVPSAQVEKRVFAFFLLERPDKRKNLGRIMKFVGQRLRGQHKDLTLEDLGTLIPQVRGLKKAYQRFHESALAKRLEKDLITIRKDK